MFPNNLYAPFYKFELYIEIFFQRVQGRGEKKSHLTVAQTWPTQVIKVNTNIDKQGACDRVKMAFYFHGLFFWKPIFSEKHCTSPN